jgi:hydroxymethylpyrimidine pyrophosphatase-like HAD family hydrolase
VKYVCRHSDAEPTFPSDVDGTLLDNNHQLHPATTSALRYIHETRPELPIVIASGKQRPSTQFIREELGLPDSFPSVSSA